jgi:hypothetical protein
VLQDCCCFCFQFDAVLLAFQLFHLASALSAAASIVANIYVIGSMSATVSIDDLEAVRSIVLRCYCILFALIIIVVEGDWRFFFRHLRIFESWFIRSIWCCLVSTITINTDDSIESLENVIGAIVFCFGIIYFMMVIFSLFNSHLHYSNYSCTGISLHEEHEAKSARSAAAL